MKPSLRKFFVEELRAQGNIAFFVEELRGGREQKLAADEGDAGEYKIRFLVEKLRGGDFAVKAYFLTGLR